MEIGFSNMSLKAFWFWSHIDLSFNSNFSLGLHFIWQYVKALWSHLFSKMKIIKVPFFTGLQHIPVSMNERQYINQI